MLRLVRLAALLLSVALFPLQAQSTITVTSSANPATYAAQLTFTVTVMPPGAGGPVPTGTVSATLPGNYLLGSATLDGTGRGVISVPQSGLTPLGLAAGSNTISFSYSGDARYAPAQSTFTQWIDKANTTTTSVLNGNVQPLHLTATVSINEPSVTTVAFGLPGNSAGGAPSGTVRFFDGATLLGTATLAPYSLLTSTATLAVSSAPAALGAIYSGDADFNASYSAPAAPVGTGPVILSATSSANPSVFGEWVTFQFRVSPKATGGPIPTGSVTDSIAGLFDLGSTTLDANDQGFLTVPLNSTLLLSVPWGFAAGSNSVILTYSGDAHYAPAQTTVTQVVNKANTATTTSLVAASTAGPSIVAIVSISEPSVIPIGFALPGGKPGSINPTGNVQFLSGSSTVVGTAALSPSGHLQSSATLVASALASSSGDIIAFYGGDANYNASISPLATKPSKDAATITVTSSANPSTFAAPVTFAVTVAPLAVDGAVPTGSVQATVFGSDSLGSATLDATGHASFTVPQSVDATASLPWGLATGSNVITVTYSGDLNYAQAQSTFNQLVDKADTTGSFTYTAGFPGVTHTGSTATVSINEALVANTAFRIPGNGNLSSSPTGNVDFFNEQNLLGTATLVPGTNFQSTTSLTANPQPTSVVYYGDTNYNGSTAPSQAPPGGAAVTITLASSANPVVYGGAFTITATVVAATVVGPTPTGIVTFYDGSRNLGWYATLDSHGRASLPMPVPLANPLVCAPTCPAAAQVMVLSAGSLHTITVKYSGDATYAAASSSNLTPPVSLDQFITPAPTAIALSTACAVLLPSQCVVVASVADAQPPSGGPFHLIAVDASGQQDGDPGGNVQFISGSAVIGKVTLTPSTVSNVTSTASLNTSNGNTNFTALYSGDANFAGSSSTVPSRNATSVTVTSNLNPSGVGQAITLIATVAPHLAILEPTGSIDFLDGATLLGRVPYMGGTATLTATFTTAGIHSLSASYSGDTNYLPSSSAAYSQSVTTQGGTGVLSLTASGSNTAVFGEQIVFFVGVTGTGTVPPHGTVSLVDGATVVGGGSLSLGSAEAIVTLPVGTHQISAVWAGDQDWPPAKSSVLAFVVNRARTVTTLTSGFAITVAAVRPGAGTPTGTVQLIDSGNQFVFATLTLMGGSAQVTTIPDPHGNVGGNGMLEAVYSGDTNFAPSTSSVLPVIVNAGGSGASILAPEEIVSIYGADLANSSAAATLPLPLSLAGASVTVTDSAGATRFAPLYYASPTQINFVVPAGTAIGAATVAFAGYSLVVTVVPVVPALYTADSSGHGLPAAQIVRVHPDGTQSIDNVEAAPIVFGSDSLYLVLYGTGIRNRTSLDHVTCAMGGVNLPVTFAGAQSQYPGLDQVIVPLPVSLKGSGAASLFVTADGKPSNVVSITFQ